MRIFVNIDGPDRDPAKPGDAVVAGLRACGCQVGDDPATCDLLLTWTPWLDTDRAVLESQFNAAGRPVIYIENGWLTPIRGVRYWQLAFGGWNGSGTFPAWKGADRWDSWGVELKPWKDSFERSGDPGETVMVAPQRGPQPGSTSPDGKGGDHRASPFWWQDLVCGYLEARGMAYEVRIRTSEEPLDEALDRSWCVMTWNSSVATKALIRGVPVRYFGPNIMASKLCTRGLQPIKLHDRLPEFRKLAGAQFNAEEIREGWPLKRLIESWGSGPRTRRAGHGWLGKMLRGRHYR